MDAAVAESIAIILLLASLGFAVLRPRGLSEAVLAVPAATLVVVLGIERLPDGLAVITRFGPTVIFLAGILLFGRLASAAGVFRFLGSAAACPSRGRPVRLLTVVVALAAAVTTVLTLDATIVLLTPVVFAAATSARVSPRPHLYACVRLANSASILLPISNLTNLLAFGSSGLSFGRFASLMALPWFFVCVGEWCVVRGFFRKDLRPNFETQGAASDFVEAGGLRTGQSAASRQPRGEVRGADTSENDWYDEVLAQPKPPRYALTVAALTIAGFVVTSALHVSPAWAAFAGSAALLAPATARRGLRPGRLVRAASLPFCAFVLALAVLVDAAMRHGLFAVLGHAIPSGTGFLALLGMAVLSAAIANVVNNLPATLALAPLVAHNGPMTLALLLGVNIGPNLSYAGSLATLLWRRIVPKSHRPQARRFHAISIVTVPATLVGACALLWAALQI